MSLLEKWNSGIAHWSDRRAAVKHWIESNHVPVKYRPCVVAGGRHLPWLNRFDFQDTRKMLKDFGHELAKTIAISRKHAHVRDGEREAALEKVWASYEKLMSAKRNGIYLEFGTIGGWSVISKKDLDSAPFCPLYTAYLRDLDRLSTGEWRRLPENLRYKIEQEIDLDTRNRHCLHISTEDEGKVAYYRNLSAMVEDRPTRTTLEKYLAQFTNLEDHVVRQMGMKLKDACLPLKFVDSSDEYTEWAEVYRNGPSSCMADGKVDDETFKAYCYPGNGLRLAYQQNSDGMIISRAIVFEPDDCSFNLRKERGYVRIYPCPHDEPEGEHLKAALYAAGYDTEINLNGVRLARHREGDRFRMPYLDSGDCGYQSVVDRDDYLLVRDGSTGGDSIECDNATGWSDEAVELVTCPCCGSLVYEGSMTSVHTGPDVCDDCIGDHYTHVVVSGTPIANGIRFANSEWVPDDEVSRYLCADGDLIAIHTDFADESCTYSDYSERYVCSDSAVSYIDCDGDERVAANFELENRAGYMGVDYPEEGSSICYVETSQVASTSVLADVLTVDEDCLYACYDGMVYEISGEDWKALVTQAKHADQMHHFVTDSSEFLEPDADTFKDTVAPALLPMASQAVSTEYAMAV